MEMLSTEPPAQCPGIARCRRRLADLRDDLVHQGHHDGIDIGPRRFLGQVLVGDNILDEEVFSRDAAPGSGLRRGAFLLGGADAAARANSCFRAITVSDRCYAPALRFINAAS